MFRLFLFLICFSPAALFGSGVQDACAQGLLVRGGNTHLTPIRMAVLVATELAAKQSGSGWATLPKIHAVLVSLDAGYFAQWQPEIHLLGIMKYLRARGWVERFGPSKPTQWRLTREGSGTVGANLAFLGRAYDSGIKRRNEKDGAEGFNVYPEWTPFTNFKECFHQELAMTFVILNSLDLDPFVPLAHLSERIKRDYAGFGYWQERKGGGAYPTQLKSLLDKMEGQGWVESKKGTGRRFFYRLSAGGVVPIYQVRAFALRLFHLLADEKR